jgi:hypothetical protein
MAWVLVEVANREEALAFARIGKLERRRVCDDLARNRLGVASVSEQALVRRQRMPRLRNPQVVPNLGRVPEKPLADAPLASFPESPLPWFIPLLEARVDDLDYADEPRLRNAGSGH